MGIPAAQIKEELNMNVRFKPRELTLLGLMTALLLVMSCTPLGYLHLGTTDITLNMIPVAITAAALGPVGGAITGTVFGITSFLQCLGIGGSSPMGVAMLAINPLFTVITCIVPRVLAGLLTGYVCRWVHKKWNSTVSGFAAGFAAAFLNTLLFMPTLVGLFGESDFIQNMMGGMSILMFVGLTVAFNGVLEALVSTVATGFLCKALEKARLLHIC